MIEDIIILPNPAETNIVDNFPNNIELIDKQYIGASRLCCGYCHKYLDDNNYQHRGKHGICDKKWRFPWFNKGEKASLEQKIKNSVKSIRDLTSKNLNLSIGSYQLIIFKKI